MHVHEMNPWRTLVVVLAFVALIIVGFVTMNEPMFRYELDMAQSLEKVRAAEDYLYPWELEDFVSGQADKIVLFDVRDNFTFGQGHIKGAVNMPPNDLLKEENVEYLKNMQEQGFTIVFYGKDELQANGIWMFLHQVGFDHVKLLLGGYDYYLQHKDNLAATQDDDAFMKEIPRYNYAEKAAPRDGEVVTSTTKKVVNIKRRQKSTVAAGGC